MSGTRSPGSSSKSRSGPQTKVPFWKRDLSSMRSQGPSAEIDVDVREPFVPRLPVVDLLPAAVRVSISAAHIRRRLYLVVSLMAAAAAVVWLLQAGQISRAESDLAAEQARSTQLTARMQALAPIQQLNDEIASQQDFVQTTLAAQPLAASVISTLVDTADAAGITGISAVAVAYHGIPAAGAALNPCPTSDPFAPEITVGCVTFSATASNRAEIASLLTLLEQDPLFVGPYVSSTTVSAGDTGSEVSFSGTVGVGVPALATPLTDEELQAIVAPPIPEPAPTDGAGEE